MLNGALRQGSCDHTTGRSKLLETDSYPGRSKALWGARRDTALRPHTCGLLLERWR